MITYDVLAFLRLLTIMSSGFVGSRDAQSVAATAATTRERAAMEYIHGILRRSDVFCVEACLVWCVDDGFGIEFVDEYPCCIKSVHSRNNLHGSHLLRTGDILLKIEEISCMCMELATVYRLLESFALEQCQKIIVKVLRLGSTPTSSVPHAIVGVVSSDTEASLSTTDGFVAPERPTVIGVVESSDSEEGSLPSLNISREILTANEIIIESPRLREPPPHLAQISARAEQLDDVAELSGFDVDWDHVVYTISPERQERAGDVHSRSSTPPRVSRTPEVLSPRWNQTSSRSAPGSAATSPVRALIDRRGWDATLGRGSGRGSGRGPGRSGRSGRGGESSPGKRVRMPSQRARSVESAVSVARVGSRGEGGGGSGASSGAKVARSVDDVSQTARSFDGGCCTRAASNEHNASIAPQAVQMRHSLPNPATRTDHSVRSPHRQSISPRTSGFHSTTSACSTDSAEGVRGGIHFSAESPSITGRASGTSNLTRENLQAFERSVAHATAVPHHPFSPPRRPPSQASSPLHAVRLRAPTDDADGCTLTGWLRMHCDGTDAWEPVWCALQNSMFIFGTQAESGGVRDQQNALVVVQAHVASVCGAM